MDDEHDRGLDRSARFLGTAFAVLLASTGIAQNTPDTPGGSPTDLPSAGVGLHRR